ncbi:MAG: hypothetical protein ACR2LA_02195, partial [Acidimicrobiales bacterium]
MLAVSMVAAGCSSDSDSTGRRGGDGTGPGTGTATGANATDLPRRVEGGTRTAKARFEVEP